MSYNKLMSQSKFAAFYGVSQPMVSRYMQQGKIPESCIDRSGRHPKIKVDCAVQALEDNLSPAKRKNFGPGQQTTANEKKAVGEINRLKSIAECSLDELVNQVMEAINVLSLTQERFADHPKSYEILEEAIDYVAERFGLNRVNVETPPCKLSVPIPID